jgi:hypothetical protein
LAPLRGDHVVVRGRRGLEVGTILGRAIRTSLPDEFIGDVLRLSTADDREQSQKNSKLSRMLCGEAEESFAAAHVPLTVLDAEVLLEGRSAIVHGLSHASCDPSHVLEKLGVAHGLIVRLYDLADESPTPAPADDHEEQFKCDKPDCGEGNCDSCSTGGGCNSCSSGGAKELAAHFATLREQMESARVNLV